MMRLSVLLVVLASSAVAMAQDQVTETPKVVSVGPALPDQVVDLYIPPTRANRPVATTMKGVHFLSPEQTSWDLIYSPTLQEQPIVATRGYAKSSKALYVIHKGGVAVTKSGGEEWTETRMNGFSVATFVDLIVHPSDRNNAFILNRNAAWITQNNGERWAAWELPGAAEDAVGMGFAERGDEAVLVYATNRSVYLSDSTFRDWTTLSREPQGPRLFSVSPTFATVQLANGTLRGYDLTRPGFTIEQPETALANGLATDPTGYGAFILQEDSTLLGGVFGLEATPSNLYTSNSSLQSLTLHPRESNAYYFAEGTQVRLASNLLPSFPQTALAAEQFVLMGVSEELQTSTNATGSGNNAEQALLILNEVMAAQPPLEEVVEKALRFSSYSEKDAENWKANVRRKNLVPEVVVGAGATERPLGQNRTVQNVDRFGVPTTEDIRQDDTTEYMGNYGVELRWNLGGLVFDKEELMVSEETRKRNEARNALITQVTDLYYRRIELLVQMKMNKNTGTLENAVQNELRLRELTDSLNALVGSVVVRDF